MKTTARYLAPHIWQTLRRFWKESRGGVLTYVAFVAPAMLGFAGLAVDVSSWYSEKRSVQHMADAAAIGGALEILRTDKANINSAAQRDAHLNGFDAGEGYTIVVNNPPLDGNYAGVGNAVEVFVEKPKTTFFSSLFLGQDSEIQARAVAIADISDICVWALDKTESAAIKVAGSATVSIGCGMIANSDHGNAFDQSGGGCLSATTLKVVGGYTGDCLYPEPITDVRPVPDPLSFLEGPDPTHCDHTAKTKVNNGEYRELYPGVYCASIEVLGGGEAFFHPGEYILDGAGLTIAAAATVTGTGVVFILTDESGSSDNLSIAGGATVNLSAIETGIYAGILFFHDRDSPDNVNHSLAGGATMVLDGIVYLPGQQLKFSGGSELDAVSAFIIADTLEFVGNTHVGAFTGSAVEKNKFLIQSELVE